MNDEHLRIHLNNLLNNGLECLNSNQNIKAEIYFKDILKLKPNHSSTLNLLGVIYVKLKKFDESIEYFKLAIKYDNNQEGFYLNLGNAYEKIKKNHLALKTYENGLKINSNSSVLFNQIGLFFFLRLKFDDAQKYFRKSLEIDPNNKFTINNLGLSEFEKSNFKSAIEYFNKCLLLDENFSTAHFNLGIVHLLNNNMDIGWEEYEWRPGKRKYSNITIGKNEWKGSSLKNKKLLILIEQGIGDSVQFIRYISFIKKENTRIILFLKKNLKPLFENINEIDEIIINENNIPIFDHYVFLLSLPNLFHKTNKIPAPLNFFKLKNEKRQKWNTRFKNLKSNSLKIGLVWQGDPINNKSDFKRSIPLLILKPILNMKKIQFFSLQKDYGSDQINKYKLENVIQNFYGSIDEKPFEDTMCILENLDLVITVDTALAHISATLGKKTWIMLSKVPDFRWGLNKSNTHWYNNVKLYRQLQINNWEDVVLRIKKDLELFDKK